MAFQTILDLLASTFADKEYIVTEVFEGFYLQMGLALTKVGLSSKPIYFYAIPFFIMTASALANYFDETGEKESLLKAEAAFDFAELTIMKAEELTGKNLKVILNEYAPN